MRWSVKRKSGPPSVNVNRARTCGRQRTVRVADQELAAHPQVREQRLAVVEGEPEVLAAAFGALDRPASHGRGEARGPGEVAARPRADASTWTSATVRPTTWRSRPARTVSTSGSSGMRYWSCAVRRRYPVAVETRRIWRRGGPLSAVIVSHAASAASCSAAFFERPSPAPSSLLPTLHHGAEQLLVVRTAVLDHVLGHAKAAVGGQLLQRRLPVKARAEQRRTLDDRVEQPVHQVARRGSPQSM